MAKFRMQHRRGGKPGAANLIKVAGLFVVLFLLLLFGIFWVKKLPIPTGAWQPAGPEERFFLPATDSTQEIAHLPAYSLGYEKGTVGPIWAACEWDARMGTDSPPSFFDSTYFAMKPPMQETWEKWGQKGQDAARRLGRLFAVGGPIADSAFFLVWLDEGTETLEGIGLVFPHKPPFEPSVVSIDSVEALSGLDLFAHYWLDSLENAVEKEVNSAHWAPQIP